MKCAKYLSSGDSDKMECAARNKLMFYTNEGC